MKRIYNILRNPNQTWNLLLVSFVLAGISTGSFGQVLKPFTQRTSVYSPDTKIYNIKGDYTMIGNTNLTLVTYDNNGNNQDPMEYVDVDGDANTLNSSSAELTLPDCSHIIYAGLYWTGRTNNSNLTFTVGSKTFNKRIVSLKGPGSGSYTQIIASTSDIYYPTSGQGNNIYSAYSEITDYVQNHGTGNYFVADLATIEGTDGSIGYSGGWGMIVVYKNSNLEWRDITIFDGHAFVEESETIYYDLPVSGFHTVQTGDVHLKLGMMVSEGDRTWTGDYFRIRKVSDGTYMNLNHSLNTTDNFFNSTILTGGNTRNPDLLNNTGVDICMFDIPNSGNNVITNNQTSTTFRYGSEIDTYAIFCIAMAVDAYIPEPEGVISLQTLNSVPVVTLPALVNPDDELGYRLQIRNRGTEPINDLKIVIPIPYTATYISSSKIVFPPASSSSSPYFDPSLGATGSVVWEFGTLPLPAFSTDVLAELFFNIKVTNDCAILTSCSPRVPADGVFSGTGAITSVICEDVPFILGYNPPGPCEGTAIPGPLEININVDPSICTDPPIRDFAFCNVGTSVPVSGISAGFPTGTRFYDEFPVDETTIEFNNLNPFPATPGTTTYFAVPPPIGACFVEFTISVDNIEGGTLNGGTTVCSGTNSTNLTLTGHIGTISKWQSSTSSDFTSGVTDIDHHTTSLEVNNLATTTYYRVVITNGLCGTENSTTATITVNTTVSIQPGANPAVCRGTTTANLSYSNALGSPDKYSITWDSPALSAGFSNVVDATLPASPIVLSVPVAASPAQYNGSLNLRNSTSGCISSSYPIAVTVNALPAAYSVTGGGAYCAGGAGVAVGLSGSQSGVNYQLFLGAAPTGATVPGSGSALTFGNKTAAGTYTVVATNATTSCTSTMTGSAIVSVNPLHEVHATVTTPILCYGGSATVTLVATGGTGPYNYTFNGQTNASGIFNNVLAGTAKSFSVTDSNTCGPVTGTIDVPQPPSLVFGTPVVTNVTCDDDNGIITIGATGGTGTIVYSISPTVGTQSPAGRFNGLSPHIYLITATDANHCSISTSVTVNSNPDVTPPDITCPANISVFTDPGKNYASLVITNPLVSDNCTPPSLIGISGTRSDGHPLTDPYPSGTTTITWVATDEYHNASITCSQIITVTDNESPLILIGPLNQSAMSTIACQAVVPDFTLSLELSDNVTPEDHLSITQSPAAGTTLGAGLHAITITIRDAANNVTVTKAFFNVISQIIANDDAGSVTSGYLGGTAVENILVNDILNCGVTTWDRVDLTLISTTCPTIQLNDNRVIVEPGTPDGTYYLVYQICEKHNPSNCDQATVTITIRPVANSDITIVKSTGDIIFSAVGDVIQYTLLVHNSSVTNSYFNLTVTDPNAVITSGSPIPILAPGATATVTALHTVTQTDLDAGKVSNTAYTNCSAQNGVPIADTSNMVTVNGLQRSQITITKYAAETEFHSVGEVIHYTFEIFNCGNVSVSDILVTDPVAVITAGDRISILAPRHTVTATGKYIVTQADINAGKIVNIAYVQGTDPAGKTIRDDSNTVTLYFNKPSRLVVTKLAKESSFDAVGDTINYDISVTNYRNTVMTAIIVTDSNAVITSGNPIHTLSSGKTALVKARHVITQKDLDAGKVVNKAKARGIDYYDTIDEAWSNESTVFAKQSSGMLLTKLSEETFFSQVGDQIHYTHEIRNTGNIRITGILLTDPNTTAIGSNEIAGLSPGESATIRTTYTVTLADLNLGKIEKTATVTGYDANSQSLQITSNTVNVQGIQKADLKVILSAAESSYMLEGDIIHYSVEIRNTGNVTLTNLNITDTKKDEPRDYTIQGLIPGATAIFNIEYPVTAADIADGKLLNTATVSGSSPAGERISGTSNEVIIIANVYENLTITKTAEETGYKQIGDVINYRITLQNHGNSPLANITVSMPEALINGNNVVSTLAPSGSITIHAYHPITQTDLDAGQVTNTALVTGKYADGREYSIMSNRNTVYGVQNPQLAAGISAAESVYTTIGQQVSYTIMIRNTGNVTVSGIILSGSGKLSFNNLQINNLAPGQVDQLSATYSVSLADLDAGRIVTSVNATGKDQSNKMVTANSNVIEVKGLQNPELKTVVSASEMSFTQVGDVIHYAIEVTNSGNVSIISTAVTDTTAVIINARPNVILLPGEVFGVSAVHVITQDDIDAGVVTNASKATGFDLNGNTIEKAGNKVTLHGFQHAELVTSIESPALTYKNKGDVIPYTVRIRNNGNVTMNDISVMDEQQEFEFTGTIPSLSPGDSLTVTADYKVTAENINAGKLILHPVASAYDLNNNKFRYSGNGITVILAIENFNLQNFPNPFAYETTIVFDLPEQGEVILKILDLVGREVGQIDKREYNKGRNFVKWSSNDTQKGVYILKMFFNGSQATKTISLMN